jgi:hypothetical protein
MTPDWTTAALATLKDWLPSFLNSNFITSLIGAGAGAWAGAYAAQRIAATTKSRDETLSEIRDTTAAFNLAVMIFNLCVNLKGQHVKQLKEVYDAKKNELFETIKKRNSGLLPPGIAFEFSADFQTLSPMSTPVEKLENIIIDRLTERRRAVIFASSLTQIIHALNGATTERNELIEEFRKSGPHTQEKLFQFYFSLPDQQGNVDNRYDSIVTAISRYTDDVIFFSKSIADDLSAHGRALGNNFESKFRTKAPSVGKLKVKDGQLGLLPDPKEYSSWDGVQSE